MDYVIKKIGDDWGVYCAHPERGTAWGVMISAHVTEASAKAAIELYAAAIKRRSPLSPKLRGAR